MTKQLHLRPCLLGFLHGGPKVEIRRPHSGGSLYKVVKRRKNSTFESTKSMKYEKLVPPFSIPACFRGERLRRENRPEHT